MKGQEVGKLRQKLNQTYQVHHTSPEGISKGEGKEYLYISDTSLDIPV